MPSETPALQSWPRGPWLYLSTCGVVLYPDQGEGEPEQISDQGEGTWSGLSWPLCVIDCNSCDSIYAIIIHSTIILSKDWLDCWFAICLINGYKMNAYINLYSIFLLKDVYIYIKSVWNWKLFQSFYQVCLIFCLSFRNIHSNSVIYAKNQI